MIKKPIVGAVAVLAICAGGYAFFEVWEPGAPAAGEARAAAVADHPPITPMTGLDNSPEALEEALAQNPSHTPILLRMGQLAIESGDAEAAVKHLREAVRSDPDSRDARLELGRALYQAGEIDDAIRETDALLARDPENVDALYNLGAIHANTGEASAARDYWSRAVAAGPGTPSGQNAKRGLEALNGAAPGAQVERPLPQIDHETAIDVDVQHMIRQRAGRQ